MIEPAMNVCPVCHGVGRTKRQIGLLGLFVTELPCTFCNGCGYVWIWPRPRPMGQEPEEKELAP